MRLSKMRFSMMIIFTLLITIGISLYSNADKNNQSTPNNLSAAEHKISSDNISNTSTINKKTELTHKEQFRINEASGNVTMLLWENDINFKNAQKKYNTPVLMNAYCAVLDDPLPGEKENVQVGTNLLCGTVVYPGKIFSQNNTIGPYTKSRGYLAGPTYKGTDLTTTVGGGVCEIASALYNVAVKSNMEILERHEHCMPVSYVPYGQDATVYYGSLDFKFKNSTNSPVLIWSQATGKALYIGFYGRSFPPKVEWHHEILSTSKAPNVYKANKNLPQHKVKEVVKGMDGAKVKSWITIEYSDKVVTKQLGKSFYSPLPYIYEKNP
jgi:vancomycin resistance protein VanW